MNYQTKALTIATFVLVVFGLVMISSAGIVDAQKKFASSYYYFTHQLLYGVIPGLLLFFFLSRIDYKLWRKVSLFGLLGAIALLILVFIPSIGLSLKGAHRWISLGPFTFQPSEVLKLALVIYLAAWLSAWQDKGHGYSIQTVPFVIVLAFIWAIFIKQPDVGTLGIITLIAFGMYFLAGAKIKHIAGMLVAVLLVLTVVVVTTPYRFNRIAAFLNAESDPRGVSYHINQSLIGIGSGGLFGLGFGQSKQKVSFLPEPVGDSIFSVIGEELGLAGMTALIAMFLFLVFTLVNIAKNARDGFGRLYVLGIAIWIASQAFINIAAISGLIPLTGIPLPFVSYGGTALIALLAALGIVRSIARHG